MSACADDAHSHAVLVGGQACDVDNDGLFVAAVGGGGAARDSRTSVAAVNKGVAVGAALAPEAALENKTEFVEHEGYKVEVGCVAAAAVPSKPHAG